MNFFLHHQTLFELPDHRAEASAKSILLPKKSDISAPQVHPRCGCPAPQRHGVEKKSARGDRNPFTPPVGSSPGHGNALPHDRNARSRPGGRVAPGNEIFFLRDARSAPCSIVIFGVIPNFLVWIIPLAQVPPVVVASPLACKILRMWPFRPRRLNLGKLSAPGGKSSQISPQCYPQREAKFALLRPESFANLSPPSESHQRLYQTRTAHRYPPAPAPPQDFTTDED